MTEALGELKNEALRLGLSREVREERRDGGSGSSRLCGMVSFRV